MDIEIIELTKEQEKRLFSGFESDNPEYVDTLLDCYGWLAEYVASKFEKMGANFELLANEAYDALVEAAAVYSVDCGERFAFFALPLIRDRVINTVMDERNATHRSESLTNALLKAKNVGNIVGNNIKNDSTDWEVAEVVGIEETTLNEIIYGKLTSMSKDDIREKSKSGVDKLKKAPGSVANGLLNLARKSIDDVLDNYKE